MRDDLSRPRNPIGGQIFNLGDYSGLFHLVAKLPLGTGTGEGGRRCDAGSRGR
jgi:hypothetical protein